MTGVINDWQPLGSPVITWSDEEQTAASGQTVYTLTQGAYTVGANMMEVYLNGLAQPKPYFTETDERTITLAAAPEAGTKVRFRYAQIFAAENAVSPAQLEAVRTEIANISLIKSVQRGVTGTAETVTIEAVDMIKTIVISVSKGSEGSVPVTGNINTNGYMLVNGSVKAGYGGSGSSTTYSDILVGSNLSPASPNISATYPINITQSGSISASGATNLTTKQYSAQLISSTQLQCDGPVEWQVIEFR